MSSRVDLTGSYRELRDADQALLDEIMCRGDDLSQPRHTLLFFYEIGGQTPSFDMVVAAAPNRNLSVSRREAEQVVLEGQLYVHPEALKSLVDWAIELARDASVEFDGWECAIVTTVH